MNGFFFGSLVAFWLSVLFWLGYLTDDFDLFYKIEKKKWLGYVVFKVIKEPGLMVKEDSKEQLQIF